MGSKHAHIVSANAGTMATGLQPSQSQYVFLRFTTAPSLPPDDQAHALRAALEPAVGTSTIVTYICLENFTHTEALEGVLQTAKRTWQLLAVGMPGSRCGPGGWVFGGQGLPELWCFELVGDELGEPTPVSACRLLNIARHFISGTKPVLRDCVPRLDMESPEEAKALEASAVSANHAPMHTSYTVPYSAFVLSMHPCVQ